MDAMEGTRLPKKSFLFRKYKRKCQQKFKQDLVADFMVDVLT